MVPTVARGAVATGVRGLFFEVHDDPDNAKSDGPNSFPVQRFADLLRELAAIAAATRGLETDPYGLAPSKKRSR
jgi:2-dehydro-3-deoxyphosphooctonate aldolase (KDO 8-P synthase)